MWRRVRPVLLMTVRDLRRRPLRTVLVAVLLALVTTIASAAVGRAVASASATSSVDPWVSAATLLVCVMALLVIGLVTAPVHLAAARRSMRQVGLLEAAGGTGREVTLALLAPAGLTALLGAVLGAPLGLLVATAPMTSTQGAGVVTTAGVGLGVVAIAVVVVVVNLLAALTMAWRVRGTSVIDTLEARLPAAPPGRAWLRFLTAAAGLAAGGAAIAIGLSRADLVLIGAGAVAAWAGMAILLATCLVALLGGVRRGPYSLRFALREGARHPMRVVPTTIASATMVALLVTAMAYVGSTHQAEIDRYVPIGPPGSALLLPDSEDAADTLEPEDVDAMTALIASIGAEARAVPVLTPDAPLEMSRPPESVTLLPAAQPQLVGSAGTPTALLATDEIVEAWNYDASVQQALAAGRLVVAPGTFSGGSGAAALDAPEGEADVVIEEILPRGPATVLLPAPVAADLGVEVHAVAVMVIGLDGTALELLAQSAREQGWWLALDQGPPALESAPTQYALLAAAAVVVALMLWIMGALAREEARPDVVTLEAVGARPAFTRWVAAWQSGGAALIAVLAGVPVGLLGTWLLMTARDTTLLWERTSLTIPWAPVLAMLVVVPVVAGVGVAALQPRRPALVRRLAD